MAQGKRFKFQGSSFAVQTGFGATKPITGINKANPAVITSVAHALAIGNAGLIAAVLGMVEMNGQMVIVDNPLVDSFEAAGVNSLGYTTYISGGTFAPAVFSDFCELTGINQQDGSANLTEVTTICSTAKEFETGLSDSGTLQLSYNFAPNQPVQSAINEAKKSAATLAFRVVLPGTGGTIIMLGVVQQASFQGAVNGIWTGSATIKLTGDIFVLS